MPKYNTNLEMLEATLAKFEKATALRARYAPFSDRDSQSPGCAVGCHFAAHIGEFLDQQSHSLGCYIWKELIEMDSTARENHITTFGPNVSLDLLHTMQQLHDNICKEDGYSAIEQWREFLREQIIYYRGIGNEQ